jgi:hypothetical protein
MACPVCEHRNRDDIEDAILQHGESLSGTARKWGFHRTSLARHMKNHVDLDLVPPPEAPPAPWELPKPDPPKLAVNLEPVADLR